MQFAIPQGIWKYIVHGLSVALILWTEIALKEGAENINLKTIVVLSLISTISVAVSRRWWNPAGKAVRPGRASMVLLLAAVLEVGAPVLYLFATEKHAVAPLNVVIGLFWFSVGANFLAFFILPELLNLLGRGGVSIAEHALDALYFWRPNIGHAQEPAPFESEQLLTQRLLEQFIVSIPPSRATVILDLRMRSARLSTRNNVLLLAVIAVLISSAFFITFSGQLASKDTESLDSLQTLRTMTDARETEIRQLEDEYASTTVQANEAAAKLTGKLSVDEQQSVKAAEAKANAKLPLIKDRLERTKDDAKELRELLPKAGEAAFLSKADSGTSAAKLLIAAGITRFGILALAIFLVQILVGLYKYNARIAGFYRSEADAIMLAGDDSVKGLGELMKSISPQVGFDKAESTFPEKVLDKINDAVDKIIEKSSDLAKATAGAASGKFGKE
jgi:hypothetical protein